MAHPDLRRAVIRFAIVLVILDACFIGVFSLLHMRARPVQEQWTFVIVWTLATLGVVMWGLGGVRRVRHELRRSRRAGL